MAAAAMPAKAIPLEDSERRFRRIFQLYQLQQGHEPDATATAARELQALPLFEASQRVAVMDPWIRHARSPLDHIVQSVIWPLFPFAGAVHNPHPGWPISDRVRGRLDDDVQLVRPGPAALVSMISRALALALQPRKELDQAKAAIELREHRWRKHGQPTAIAAGDPHLEDVEIANALGKDARARVDAAHNAILTQFTQ